MLTIYRTVHVISILTLQDGSCDEYLLLIEKGDSCEKEGEDVMGSEKATDCIPVDIDPHVCGGVLQIPKPAVNNDTAALQTDSSLDSAYGSQNVDSSLPVRSTSSYISLKRHQTDEDSGVFSPMTSSIKVPVEGGEDSRTLTPSPEDYSTRSTDVGDLSEVPENTATLAQDYHAHMSEMPPVNHAPFRHTPVPSAAINPPERDNQPGRKSDTPEIPRHQSYSGCKPSYIIKKVNKKALSEPAPVSLT